MEEDKQINLEEAFGQLMGGGMESQSVDGDAQLLEVAEKHTLQLDGQQIKCLLHLRITARRYLTNEADKEAIDDFIKTYLAYTSRNSSQGFISQVLEFISLRRYINSDAIKVNVDKNT